MHARVTDVLALREADHDRGKTILTNTIEEQTDSLPNTREIGSFAHENATQILTSINATIADLGEWQARRREKQAQFESSQVMETTPQNKCADIQQTKDVTIAQSNSHPPDSKLPENQEADLVHTSDFISSTSLTAKLQLERCIEQESRLRSTLLQTGRSVTSCSQMEDDERVELGAEANSDQTNNLKQKMLQDHCNLNPKHDFESETTYKIELESQEESKIELLEAELLNAKVQHWQAEFECNKQVDDELGTENETITGIQTEISHYTEELDRLLGCFEDDQS